MKRLTTEQVIQLHQALITETGGLDGIRDINLLESALNSPFQSFDGLYVCPTIESKAARLGYGLVMNHAFLDGNKRIGLLVMLVFLEINGVELAYSDKELISLGLGVADGTMDDKALLTWIIAHN
jgi:death on curing protein